MYSLVLLLHVSAAAMAAQTFAGAMAGISTLSGDGRTTVSSEVSAVSLYKPENGFTGMVYGGRHFSDWISAQASYSTNANDLLLTSVGVAGGVERTYEQARRARMHTVLWEWMVYFRGRQSRLRPYLSAGPGFTQIATKLVETRVSKGNALPPGASSSDRSVALRVAVGMDVKLGGHVWLRYSFAETIQRNAVSRLLTPVGKRNLANFQNLFGVQWQF